MTCNYSSLSNYAQRGENAVVGFAPIVVSGLKDLNMIVKMLGTPFNR